MRILSTGLAILFASCSSISLYAADAVGTVVDTPGQHADVVVAGKPLVRYMYNFDEANKFDTAKVYLHVMAPDGESTLTKGTGDKFPHHRGIFIGWNKISHGGKSYDIWHVKNTDQKHVSFSSAAPDDKTTPITANIAWRDSEGKVLINESRSYIVRHDDPAAYALIDVVTTLTPVGSDIVLNGDPEHAGIQFRAHEETVANKSAKYTFPETLADEKAVKAAQDLPWIALNYQNKGNSWSVQFMNHPDNPKNTRHSAYRDYGRFGHFPVVKIADGSSATLRYRVRITAGDMPDLETLNKAHATFIGK